MLLDGRSAWRGGVGWGGDGARWGARRWPVSAWWAGAGGQSSDDSPVEARSSRGVNPTHTEPQPDTAGGKHDKVGTSTRGNPPANRARRGWSVVGSATRAAAAVQGARFFLSGLMKRT